MTQLLGPNGQPISSSTFQNKKVAPPPTGEKFGSWGGPDTSFFKLPGGGAIQFDLDALTLGDYRQMRDHYQINSSLSLLMFLLHQLEFRIECSDKKQRDFYTEQMENMWTPLVRSKSTAFWAGYSPNVLQWENDVAARRTVITKIKDLVPEESAVHWKKVDGANNHKINVYDGIKNWGNNKPIPPECSYWYPLLMENGNYYGRKLLRSAFQPWFFSLLLHLFANRYYERFGEPTPIGRAPYEDDIRFGGETMRGSEAMELILSMLRNRSAVVLPNDRTQVADETNPSFDYSIEYLESQMRGADFERYMTRLDEEMSLALFTPILMMRTADVGSYNLGTQHNQTYKLLLNAISGDWKFYIDWYILRPLRDYNFGTNAELPRISFRKLGQENGELINNIVAAMIGKGQAKPDLEQIGEMAGLTLKEVRQLTSPEGDDPEADPSEGSTGDGQGAGSEENRRRVGRVTALLSERIRDQVNNAYSKDKIRDTQFSMGYQRQFDAALREAGFAHPTDQTRKFYRMCEAWLGDVSDMGVFGTAEDFMKAFDRMVDTLLGQLFASIAVGED